MDEKLPKLGCEEGLRYVSSGSHFIIENFLESPEVFSHRSLNLFQFTIISYDRYFHELLMRTIALIRYFFNFSKYINYKTRLFSKNSLKNEDLMLIDIIYGLS